MELSRRVIVAVHRTRFTPGEWRRIQMNPGLFGHLLEEDDVVKVANSAEVDLRLDRSTEQIVCELDSWQEAAYRGVLP